jgi:hypothetical protein
MEVVQTVWDMKLILFYRMEEEIFQRQLIVFIRVLRIVRWMDHVTCIKTWEICNIHSKTWRNSATWQTSQRKEGKIRWHHKRTWFWWCEFELYSPRWGPDSGYCECGKRCWESITLKFSHRSHLVSALKIIVTLKEKLGCGEQTITLTYITLLGQLHKQISWRLQATTRLLLL